MRRLCLNFISWLLLPSLPRAMHASPWREWQPSVGGFIFTISSLRAHLDQSTSDLLTDSTAFSESPDTAKGIETEDGGPADAQAGIRCRRAKDEGADENVSAAHHAGTVFADGMDSMRQSTLNFDGCAPALRDDDSDDGDCSSCDCGAHTENMNDEYMCICSRERCDYETNPESCNCHICWEERIEEDLSLCALRPGYFHHHHESHFTDAVWEDDQWDHEVLRYYEYSCTPKDLKQFVQQRGLLDVFPAGLTLKYYYIKELVTADNARVFRFLDLPPELRNEVYGYLLAPWSHYHRHAGILRVCKAINKEATEILYADNLITCEFWSRDSYGEKKVRINTHNYLGVRAVSFTQLPTAIDCYPRFLARIRKLKVDLNINMQYAALSPMRNHVADFLRSGLLALASVMMTTGRLRTLEVNFNVDLQAHDVEAEFVASILYPLRRLRNVEAKLGGNADIPDSLREDVIGDMCLQDPSFNTLKHCQLVLSDAEAYMRLINLLDPSPANRERRDGSSRAALIARQVQYLRSKMTNARSLFADWLGEVKVQTHLAKLQKQLEDVPVAKTKEMVESMSKTTRDRVQYQQTEHQRWSIGDLARAKSPSPDPAPL